MWVSTQDLYGYMPEQDRRKGADSYKQIQKLNYTAESQVQQIFMKHLWCAQQMWQSVKRESRGKWVLTGFQEAQVSTK
jgi:hypothetical protein